MWPFDVPTEPPPGGAILQVEVCGMCGTDVTPFHADLGMQSTGTRRR
jgi:threonine dehydrogenase-like Zn-dependent dehydrogenase